MGNCAEGEVGQEPHKHRKGQIVNELQFNSNGDEPPENEPQPCLSDPLQNKKTEQNYELKKWKLLQICEQLAKEICLTSGTVDEFSTILLNLLNELNETNFAQSKQRIGQFFSKNGLGNKITSSYASHKEQQKFHYYKVLEEYKKSNNIQFFGHEEKARLFHTFASLIEKIGYSDKYSRQQFLYFQNMYSEKIIEQLVTLECIEGIVEGAGQKFNFKYTELKRETQRMSKMLKETHQKYAKQLKALKFDLENQSDYLSAAEISQFACKFHEKGIYYLIVYFKRGFENLEAKKKGTKEIEEITKGVLDELGKIYRPGQKLTGLDQHKESFKELEFKIKDLKQKIYKFQEGDKQSQLNNFIIEEAKAALLLRGKFQSLISECCLRQSLWSKTGLKINPNDPNAKARIRITEKLLFKKRPANQDQSIKHELSETIDETLLKEEDGYRKKIKKSLAEISEIKFTISDMLRGKCIFSGIEDILAVIRNIKKFVSENADTYELVEVENRFTLQNPISDFTLKIKIDNRLVTQLQLSLQSNFAIYNFAHKIYEFVRAKMFSKIKTLFNYFGQYSKQMSEMIASQLHKNNQYKKQEKQDILSYFQIMDEIDDFSISKSLLKKIKSIPLNGQQFLAFVDKFKEVEPAISFIFYRKLGMINESMLKQVASEKNQSVKEMMILQFMRLWNPLSSQQTFNLFKKNQSVLRNSYLSLRNLLMYQQYTIIEETYNLTQYIYGYHSIEMALYFFQLASTHQNFFRSPFQSTDKYYKLAINSISGLPQKNLPLEHKMRLKYVNFLFKMDKISKETVKELEELVIEMKKSKKNQYALEIELLLSDYYLRYESDEAKHKQHDNYARQIGKMEDITLNGQQFNETEWRMWKHRFSEEETPAGKIKMFTEKLRYIIAEFGSYLQFKEICQRVEAIKDQIQDWLEDWEPQLIDFKPNLFQTSVSFRHLTELRLRILSKMSYPIIKSISVHKSSADGSRLCKCLNKFAQNIKSLFLGQCNITDEGLRALNKGNWPKLQHVFLKNNGITDNGAWTLQDAKWPNLQGLILNENRITSKGVKYLEKANWPMLKTLNLDKNPIQRDDIHILEQAFPKAVVHAMILG